MDRLHLTSWQRRRLRRQLREACDVRLFRRTLAVLEFDQGRSAADIARMLGVTRQTVHNWLAAFATTPPPDTLAEGERPGQPDCWTRTTWNCWSRCWTLPPDVGFPHGSWTAPPLREALAVATSREASCDTIRRQLAEWDFVWKRPRYALAPDPLREKKLGWQT